MFLRANRDCPGYWTSWAIAPRVPAVHGQSLLCACFKLGTPVASPSQHSLFAGVVVVHRVITAREKELAVLYYAYYPAGERQLLLLYGVLHPHNQYQGGGTVGQPVPYYGHLSSAWVDKEPCTNCRQHMFNMLLVYQGAIQPNAQMLLTANFGEEQMTKQPFQQGEPPFALDSRWSALLESCDPGQGD